MPVACLGAWKVMESPGLLFDCSLVISKSSSYRFSSNPGGQDAKYDLGVAESFVVRRAMLL